MKKLREKLSENGKKDDDTLYSELLSTKLRKLSVANKLRAKHDIDNLMFKYLLQEESLMIDQSSKRNTVVGSPTPGSPVFEPYYQEKSPPTCLPSISTFKGPQIINQAGAFVQGESYTNLIHSPSNEILPGDLFRKFRGNGQHNNN